ncbi:unnamed protein product [Prunus brigantina]
MTSEVPESTSPVTITETEPTVRSPASEPIITERTAESVQEQAVVEDLMDKQACRIETSFMAAMDRFSSELRTLFQERMPTSAFVTPPGAGQRSQESGRFEPYGEGSSHGTPARAPTSGYAQHGGPVHTMAVHTLCGNNDKTVLLLAAKISRPGSPGRGDVRLTRSPTFGCGAVCARACQHGLPCSIGRLSWIGRSCLRPCASGRRPRTPSSASLPLAWK